MSKSVKINLNQVSEATSSIDIRSHQVFCDRPEAKGGHDQGPMGGELLLAGVAGCFTSNLLAAIRAREAQVSDVHIDITGTLEENPTRFTEIDLSISAKYGDLKEMEKLITIAERGCIAANSIKDSIRLTITLN